MSGLEDRFLTLIKDLEEEKRLADKRAKQLYLAAGGGSFIDHDDTPAVYAGGAGKFVKVNAVPDGLEFIDHDKAIHDALAIDHGSLGGRGDDDHSIYYNATRHTKAVHDALLITVLGSGALAKDHGAAATDMLVNVCYGTGSPPAAGGTTIGTIFLKYTA